MHKPYVNYNEMHHELIYIAQFNKSMKFSVLQLPRMENNLTECSQMEFTVHSITRNFSLITEIHCRAIRLQMFREN